MEDIKAYIESGILELYVTSQLSPAEMQEVDKMVAKHSKVKDELLAIEQSLENYARTYAIEPPTELRSKIFTNLALTEKKEAKHSNLQPNNQFSNFYKYAFAACFALLLISAASLFVLYGRLQESKQQLAQLQDANQMISSRVNFMENKLEESEESLYVLRDPSYKMIKLIGLPKAKDASLVVAWNKAKNEVMLDLSSIKMPDNDTQHQYQLWALVNGKPVDLGVFDINKENTGMKKMKALENQAQAFAVTLEPRGGSINPTMDQMMAMGSI